MKQLRYGSTNDDESSVDCWEENSRSVADSGSSSKTDDGGEKDTSVILRTRAHGERLGKELSTLLAGWEKSKRTKMEEKYGRNNGADRMREEV